MRVRRARQHRRCMCIPMFTMTAANCRMIGARDDEILAGAMATAVVALFVFMLTRLSSDALNGCRRRFGVLAGIPSAAVCWRVADHRGI